MFLIKKSLLLIILLALLGTACNIGTTNPTAKPTSNTVLSTVNPNLLATPYAQQPAAGICASFEGEMVTVIINGDMPAPRCAKVRADQTLTVVNNTQNKLEVSLGRFDLTLQPGDQNTIDVPFGEYLEPGVHQLQVNPCCEAEIWLESSQ